MGISLCAGSFHDRKGFVIYSTALGSVLEMALKEPEAWLILSANI